MSSKSYITLKTYFSDHPVAVEGVGRSSGTRNPQRGFEAYAVEVEVDLATSKPTVRWYGRKHGREISTWFISSDPALTAIRRDAVRVAVAAAKSAAAALGQT